MSDIKIPEVYKSFMEISDMLYDLDLSVSYGDKNSHKEDIKKINRLNTVIQKMYQYDLLGAVGFNQFVKFIEAYKQEIDKLQ